MFASRLLRSVVCVALFIMVDTAIANDELLPFIAKKHGRTAAELEEEMGDCQRDQLAMNTCAVYEFERADFQLNAIYRDLQRARGGRDAKQLRAAQRAWVTFRDQDCAYEASDVAGGTLYTVVELHCKKERTNERIDRLKDLLSCTSLRGTCLRERK